MKEVFVMMCDGAPDYARVFKTVDKAIKGLEEELRDGTAGILYLDEDQCKGIRLRAKEDWFCVFYSKDTPYYIVKVALE